MKMRPEPYEPLLKSATFIRSAGTPPVAVPFTFSSGAYEPCSSAAQLLAWPPWE